MRKSTNVPDAAKARYCRGALRREGGRPYTPKPEARNPKPWATAGTVPDPAKEKDPQRRAAMERSLNYMGLKPNQKLDQVPIEKVRQPPHLILNPAS